uniref:[histone H3]-lysine(4) N-methyltransferase n=2 Tax=Eptatretus burgeri TaxID=7764 RepID=A0A8C4WWR3_EPTBU
MSISWFLMLFIKLFFRPHLTWPPIEDHYYALLSAVPHHSASPDAQMTDTRQCVLCLSFGDDRPEASGRLLYAGEDNWLHVNCALWSAEVVEKENGALEHVHTAISRGKLMRCEGCGNGGATVGCYLPACQGNFHFACAKQVGCTFQRDRQVYCPRHASLVTDLEPVCEFTSHRRLFVDTEGRALRKRFLSSLHPSSLALLLGSLQVENLGHLCEQSDRGGILYPLGYKCHRVFWSTVHAGIRTTYHCKITRQPQRNSVSESQQETPHNTVLQLEKHDHPQSCIPSQPHTLPQPQAQRQQPQHQPPVYPIRQPPVHPVHLISQAPVHAVRQAPVRPVRQMPVRPIRQVAVHPVGQAHEHPLLRAHEHSLHRAHGHPLRRAHEHPRRQRLAQPINQSLPQPSLQYTVQPTEVRVDGTPSGLHTEGILPDASFVTAIHIQSNEEHNCTKLKPQTQSHWQNHSFPQVVSSLQYNPDNTKIKPISQKDMQSPVNRLQPQLNDLPQEEMSNIPQPSSNSHFISQPETPLSLPKESLSSVTESWAASPREPGSSSTHSSASPSTQEAQSEQRALLHVQHQQHSNGNPHSQTQQQLQLHRERPSHSQSQSELCDQIQKQIQVHPHANTQTQLWLQEHVLPLIMPQHCVQTQVQSLGQIKPQFQEQQRPQSPSGLEVRLCSSPEGRSPSTQSLSVFQEKSKLHPQGYLLMQLKPQAETKTHLNVQPQSQNWLQFPTHAHPPAHYQVHPQALSLVHTTMQVLGQAAHAHDCSHLQTGDHAPVQQQPEACIHDHTQAHRVHDYPHTQPYTQADGQAQVPALRLMHDHLQASTQTHDKDLTQEDAQIREQTVAQIQLPTHDQTQTHSHGHAQIGAQMHDHAHAQVHMQIHDTSDMLQQQVHDNIYIQTQPYVPSNAHAQARPQPHVQDNSHTQTEPEMHDDAHTHTQAQTNNAHMQPQVQHNAHTQTHVSTHTQVLQEAHTNAHTETQLQAHENAHAQDNSWGRAQDDAHTEVQRQAWNHACTHECRHSQAQVHDSAQDCAQVQAHNHAQDFAQAHVHAHDRLHNHAQPQAHDHAKLQVHDHANVQEHDHVHMQMLAHTQTPAQDHVHMHEQSQTHENVHTQVQDHVHMQAQPQAKDLHYQAPEQEQPQAHDRAHDHAQPHMREQDHHAQSRLHDQAEIQAHDQVHDHVHDCVHTSVQVQDQDTQVQGKHGQVQDQHAQDHQAQDQQAQDHHVQAQLQAHTLVQPQAHDYVHHQAQPQTHDDVHHQAQPQAHDNVQHQAQPQAHNCGHHQAQHQAPEHTPIQPQAPEGTGAQPQAPEGTGAQPQAPERTGAQPQAPEHTGSQPQAPERTGSQPQAPELTGAQPQAPEHTGAQPQAPEGTGAQPQAPEGTGAQTQTPEGTGAQTQALEGTGAQPQGPATIQTHMYGCAHNSLHTTTELQEDVASLCNHLQMYKQAQVQQNVARLPAFTPSQLCNRLHGIINVDTKNCTLSSHNLVPRMLSTSCSQNSSQTLMNHSLSPDKRDVHRDVMQQESGARSVSHLPSSTSLLSSLSVSSSYLASAIISQDIVPSSLSNLTSSSADCPLTPGSSVQQRNQREKKKENWRAEFENAA